MANKGPSFGLSRDVQAKIEKKYDDELEERLVEWVALQCGSEVGRPERGRLGFQVWLKNGIVSSGSLSLPGYPWPAGSARLSRGMNGGGGSSVSEHVQSITSLCHRMPGVRVPELGGCVCVWGGQPHPLCHEQPG